MTALKVFGGFVIGVAVLVASFYSVVSLLWGVPRYHGPITDHFDGRHFNNLEPVPQRGLGRYLAMRLRRWATHRSGSVAADGWPVWVNDPPQPPPPARVAGLRVTFINHATLLIQMNGLNILTDPQWSERASPVSWGGPKRHRAPGVAFDALPPIDVILVSHNHYDHMDIPTLQKLEARDHPKIFVGLGNSAFLKTQSLPSVELEWWQRVPIGEKVSLTFVPAKHFSARSVNDRNNALWGGFVVDGPEGAVYFAGDTAYGPHFTEIGQHFPSINVAMLPIGAYRPQWFMGAVHISPEEAVQAAMDLNARTAVPMHYGTFQLSEEAMDDPVKELQQETARRGVKSFVILKTGEGKDF